MVELLNPLFRALCRALRDTPEASHATEEWKLMLGRDGKFDHSDLEVFLPDHYTPMVGVPVYMPATFSDRLPVQPVSN